MSNILDPIVSAILFFIFCLVILVAYFVFNSLVPSGIFGAYAGTFEQFFGAINNVSIFIMLGMSLGAILSALLIRTHPAFFFISIILVFVQFLVVPILVTAFNGIASSSSFASSATGMATNIWIMQQLPIWTALATLIAGLVGIGRGE